jgi:protease-4
MTSKRSWIFWILFALVGFVSLMMASIYFFLRGMQPAVPILSEGSVIGIDLAQRYPEERFYSWGGPFSPATGMVFRELVFGIKAAKHDERVEKLFVHVRATGLGWAQAAELRTQLLDFKDSGKPIVAFIEYATNRDYYLASAADEIFMHPRSILDLRGVRAEVTYLKSTLDKLGVEAEFERIGAYKSAPEVFLRHDMSEESREVLSELVGTMHDALVVATAEGRAMSDADARSLVARGPLTAEEALAAGLVDGLEYLDEVQRRLASEEASPESFKTIDISSYRQATKQLSAFGADARIAIIYGLGAITGGGSSHDAVFGRTMGSDTLAEAFQSVREDDSIDAVVFRIDSPGGSDVASDVIWREATLTREKKPVIVSMANMAASGGYWIATASDAIVAEATTVTGSIGIFAGKFNLAGLYEKIGFDKEGVESVENASFFSDSRPFTEEERERLRAIIDSGYQAFLERVSKARDKTTEEVDEMARGRVWSGQAAFALGLVDELGGLERALALAKERAGFDETATVELIIYPEKPSVFQAILSKMVLTGERAPIGLDLLDPQALYERSPVLRMLQSGHPLALLPYSIDIR